ncbi:MAG: 30S ribosomal protein S8e, partial [Methanosarcinales archaeon]|nr:30S ribosomal protein S8e [Methanosarcinales archaeon]
MKFQGKSRRIETGGRLISGRGKRKAELGRENADTHVATDSYKKSVDVRGGGSKTKIKLLRANIANITNPADGTTKLAEIKT